MKKLLVVVDYQNDFVEGSLGFPEAKTLEDKICKKIKEYYDQQQDVVFTLDTHDDSYLTTEEGLNLPIKHAIKGTFGWQLYGKVKNMMKSPDQGIEKDTFGSRKLASYLQAKKHDEIELVGIITNMCVIANAIIAKTYNPNAKIIVDAECTASNDYQLHNKALDVMESLQIKIKNRN
ncbi:MAG TPA: isochorismatase family cysteine hydrolase [Bacilli bacterium]|nr:isochorismatase family cysteine hydrolase [Bacilli bacterium]HQP14235.1 isochorismatase family cysteine hydrolase [Bacilli bacterium]